MDPPIHTEYLRSCGAMTLTRTLAGAKAETSSFNLSAMPRTKLASFES